jgi:hypothetical protein
MNLIKLPGPRFINLDRINQIYFFPDSETCRIEWATGDAPSCLKGSEAIAFLNGLEGVKYVDVSMLLTAENEPCLGGEDKYDDV